MPLLMHSKIYIHAIKQPVAISCCMVWCVQAQEQLLLELELGANATSWRHRRQQQHVLGAWRAAAAAAVHARQQEAKRQETWDKVQLWLSEMKAGKRHDSVSSGEQAVSLRLCSKSCSLAAAQQLVLPVAASQSEPYTLAVPERQQCLWHELPDWDTESH